MTRKKQDNDTTLKQDPIRQEVEEIFFKSMHLKRGYYIHPYSEIEYNERGITEFN